MTSSSNALIRPRGGLGASSIGFAIMLVGVLRLAVFDARQAAADRLPTPRPLPSAPVRSLGTGSSFYVDPQHGDDKADGSKLKPWRSLQHAVDRLSPGATLYLRGGTYYERVTITTSGTAREPITIRAAPGEFAILDGGLREFADSPATAWEPYDAGAAGEYRSTRTYDLDKPTADGREVWVTGRFADTMIPLHGYKYDVDLRADNPYWNVENTKPGNGVYVGPGVWFDWTTKRIHIRLAHTTLNSLGAANYRGETDPRKIPLVIEVNRTPLRLQGTKYVRVQDLVVRGSSTSTVAIEDSSNIELDGVTLYGGSPALLIKSTSHFKLVRSTLRGTAAPWSSRASMKYRGNSPYLFVASSRAPQSADWEIAYNEFTDGHDGLVLDSIQKLRFHHNLVENFNDDGLYLTFPPRDFVPQDVQVYENVFRRVYTTLAFAEHKGKRNAVGPGIFIFRNVFDLRDGTYGWIPKDQLTDARPLELQASRLCGDHGNPVWDPLFFYNNTVITAGNSWRDYYGAQMGVVGMIGNTSSTRRVFNNIFVQLEGNPGLSFQGVEPTADLQVDFNLLWSTKNGPGYRGDYFVKHKASRVFSASKKVYGPGWAANDIYAEPGFTDLQAGDFRLAKDSPGVNAGMPLSPSWPDTLRPMDRGKPDLGALPLGAPPLRVGPSNAPAIGAH
jgi:hypothetical protein